VIALGNFVLSVLLVLAVFEVPFKGSWLAYGIGALIYVQAATAWACSSRCSPAPRSRRSSPPSS